MISRIIATITLVILFTLQSKAQKNIQFKSNTKAMVVENGDLVDIQVDTAYVLSYSSGQLVKQRRVELIRMRSINDSLETILVSNVNKLQELNIFIDSLKNQAIVDSVSIASSFQKSINNLNNINANLRTENSKLQNIQKEQKTLLNEQENHINSLKKKTKGLWWSGVKDKLVAFGGGIIIGVFVASIL